MRLLHKTLSEKNINKNVELEWLTDLSVVKLEDFAIWVLMSGLPEVSVGDLNV